MPTDPALTPGTIQGLIDQLGQDLIDVLGSATVDAALKHDIEVRIKQLQVQLAHAKNELQALVAGWASQFEPAFAALTPLLKQALNLAATDQGACHYDGGCIVTTSTQCAGRGRFDPGKDCDGNPLP